jgi:hypothetical protein
MRTQPLNRKDVLGGHAVRRRDIENYFTEDFARAFRIWSDYKRFGLPYAGGYARQPAQIIEIIRLFENEHTAWQNAKQAAQGKMHPVRGRKKK